MNSEQVKQISRELFERNIRFVDHPSYLQSRGFSLGQVKEILLQFANDELDKLLIVGGT